MGVQNNQSVVRAPNRLVRGVPNSNVEFAILHIDTIQVPLVAVVTQQLLGRKPVVHVIAV